ncbi:MAG: cell surface protein SprA [Bacteroidales bacterium]|nr:cell surface protein SprA [Bacteroidales bacterium]
MRDHIVLYPLLLLFAGPVPLTASSFTDATPYIHPTAALHGEAFFQPDTTLPFPIEEGNYPLSNSNSSPLYLDRPANVQTEIVYDPETDTYVISEKVGSWNYRTPNVMSNSQYREYQFNQAVQDYWKLKSGGGVLDEPSFIPSISLGGEAFDKVFGSNTINIVPSGSAELIFGFNYSRIDNPNITERLRRTPSFQFDEKIIMNVSGSIGEKLNMDFSYNTEATFDFDQKTKLEYAGEEDEIIKKIEAGNVSLPLPGSLISGSMSLFGLKTELQFGKLNVTTVFSQQRGESQVIEASGGAQVSEFSVTVDDYDVNKHFFLADYFRENYNDAMQRLPVITSDVTITKIEVWVTNKTTNFEESRNILAVTDLGEADPYSSVFSPNNGAGGFPRNAANNAYDLLTTSYSAIREIKNVTGTLESAGLNLGRDFEKIENARLLSPREYDFNEKLGYISLNSALNTDEVLAVAYEFTFRGQTYQVGELSTSAGVSAPKTLILKLVKPSNFTPRSYTWDLMMKNVYAIGAYQVQQDEFTLDVLYRDDKTGNSINYLPEGELNKSTLLSLLNLDNMNSQKDPYPDGIFDFMRGITILPDNGRVIFPLLEPFGSDLEAILRDSLSGEAADLAVNKYVFQALYDSTKTKAQQIAEKNKFMLAGTYSSSSSSEIMLNAMNVPEGSVKVTAGGRELVEGQDYTVDYTLGRVTIINQGILESGTPVRVSLENQSLFNFQTKTMVGTHLDYTISNNFNVGATLLHLNERPHTQKVNIGDEPISNTIWGLNTSYSKPAPLLTTLVDKLPFIETKAPSQLTVVGEFAHLIPGHARAIQKEGNAYIDDFEGSETSIDMKHYSAWHLASTPRDYFPEAELNNNREYGYGRAKFSWYQIDPLFLRNKSTTPQHIRENPNLQSNPYVYELYEQDIFPEKENPHGTPTNISVLNVAYYPRERGPYNYDFQGLDQNGRLLNPEGRWGGMMREIYSSDFEAANVEFIEFWIMDPYAGMDGAPGGELVFNLGNVSEDILKDSRKFFENGLPVTENVEKVDTTVWGRVPVVQSLVNAFNSDPATRRFQDVGLDGLDNEDELSFFSSQTDDFLQQIEDLFVINQLSEAAYQAIIDDPSADDYHYYRGSDYDVQELGILDRYKNFNNPEGNSPSDLDNDESYATSGTTLPDIEDINRDNTLSESEAYYEYVIDMSPSEFEVGRNYIVDEVIDQVEYENGETQDVSWYQFRVPIYDYQRAVGGISDFKTIRFMRMFLTGFQDTVFLRFAKLELVRGEWRRYNLPFIQGGEDWTGIEPPEGTLAISAVSIEENSGKQPVNYTLPPGFTRQISPTEPQLRQLNEQSIVLKVLELGDGDARAAYKNTELDMRQYGKIQMEAHAEALIDGSLRDKELSAFIRIGSDYQSNYYEYEVPLVLTPHGRYDNDSEADRRIVWPEENRFEIDLSQFTDVKQERNREMGDPNSNVTINSAYFKFDEKGNKVTVSGNPNMSSIRTIMIGVRNPQRGSNLNIDDGLPKSGEIWLNELRLTDFDEGGGWAANGRASARLADFGNVTLAGSTSTPGFGSIEQKVNERSREQIIQYDVSSNFEMGKVFKEEAGVSIPLYVGYSKSIVNPEYNPLDPDIPLKEAIENARDEAERDSIKRYSQDIVERKSFALTNLRVNPQGSGQPKIWSISNWSTSLSLNEMSSTNPNLNYYNTTKVRANLTYNYTTRPNNVQPFNKVKLFNNKWLRMFKDINFYYLPSRLSFRTDMDRKYLEKQTRNINNPDFIVQPTFMKDFYWNRDYTMKFDFTRNLKLDFSASNIARIDEPEGRYHRDRDDFEMYRDSVLQNIMEWGRTTSYYHQFNLSYTLPINKIPLLDWITLNTRYNGTYGWDVGPIIPDDPVLGEINLGNTIKNSYTLQFNGQMNFVNLYNKVDYLKSINDKYRGSSSARGGARGGGRAGQQQQQEDQRTKTKTFEQTGVFFRENSGRFVTHNLRTENIKVAVYDENGQEVENDFEILSNKRIRVTTPEAVRNGRLVVTGTVVKGQDPLSFILENTVRMTMAVRTLNLTYSRSGGTLLPGYVHGTSVLGMQEFDNKLVPGWEYISGWYRDGFAEDAFNNGWLTYDEALNDPFNQNYSERFNFRANVEPLKGLRIDLTGNYTKSENTTEFFTSDGTGTLPPPDERGRDISGNFSMSFFSWGTAFEPITERPDSLSASFDYLKTDARKEISNRLADEYRENTGISLPDSAGYYERYGPTSQAVLIPAFLAAYGYQDAGKVPLNGYMDLDKSSLKSVVKSVLNVMPNWKVTYDGLGQIEFMQQYVNSLTLNHAYRSTYSVGSFVSNPYYEGEIINDEGEKVPITYDLQDNFMVERNINSVTISEQFSPLFNISMDWKNSLTTRFEVKKARTVGLNMANTQVNEVRSNEYVFGAGYRFNSVQLIINNNEISSDLNVRVDFSYRNNQTVIRKLEDISGSEITAGQEILSVKATADYMLSDKFTLRAFYDQRINKPYISNSYDNANYNMGFSLTFTL